MKRNTKCKINSRSKTESINVNKHENEDDSYIFKIRWFSRNSHDEAKQMESRQRIKKTSSQQQKEFNPRENEAART